MQANLKNIDDLNVVLTLSFAKEDYEGDYNKQLEDYGKKASFPGFRPGKAPKALVKKKYGTGILAELMNNKVSEELNKTITEKELNILGQPIPANEEGDKADFQNPDEFVFSFEMGLTPEVEVKLTKQQKYPFYKIKADEEMIDRQIEDYTRRYGKLSDPDQSGEKDMLVGEIVELENGEIKEGGIFNNATIALEFLTDEDQKKALVGLGAGDHAIVDIDKVTKSVEDKAKMLGVNAQEAANHTGDFRFNIKEIKRLEPAELNQELFDKIHEAGTVTSEKELREKVAESLEAGFEGESKRLFRKHLMEKLRKKLNIELPETFLKKWIKTANEKPISDEELERDFPKYADNLREQLIDNAIVQAHEINIQPEELMDYIRKSLTQQYAQYGMQAQGIEWDNYIKQIMADANERNKYAEALVQEKVIDFAKDNVKLAEEEVSYQDFLGMMYDLPKKEEA